LTHTVYNESKHAVSGPDRWCFDRRYHHAPYCTMVSPYCSFGFDEGITGDGADDGRCADVWATKMNCYA